MLFDLQLWPWNGLFEIKEHLVALGFFCWRPHLRCGEGRRRLRSCAVGACLPTVLAAIVWYALLAGHLSQQPEGVGF